MTYQMNHPMMQPFPAFPQVPQSQGQPYMTIDQRFFALEQRTFMLEGEVRNQAMMRERAESKINDLEEEIIRNALEENRKRTILEENMVAFDVYEKDQDELHDLVYDLRKKVKKHRRKNSQSLDIIRDTLQCYDDVGAKVNKIVGTLQCYDLECYDNVTSKINSLEHTIVRLQLEMGLLKCREKEEVSILSEAELADFEEEVAKMEIEIEVGEMDDVSESVSEVDELEINDAVLPIAPGLYETLFPTL